MPSARITLARWLQDQPRDRAVAILAERLRRAEHLRRMLNDGDWELDAELRERSRLLISYLRDVNDLIPDDMPLVGHLDDALLVELAWPAFRGETLDYGDFCRFRSAERPRGTAAERRLAWENACLAEAALLQHVIVALDPLLGAMMQRPRIAAVGEAVERISVVRRQRRQSRCC